MIHIEVWRGANRLSANGRVLAQRWHWHMKSRNGRVVSDAEAFATKAGAIRAAQSVVRQVVNLFPGKQVYFTATPDGERTILRWS